MKELFKQQMGGLMFAEILSLDPSGKMRKEMLAALLERPTMGLEVTHPELAAACSVGNVDPQHSGGRTDLSAIEAVAALLGGNGAVATIRPDLDSLGAMAVLDIAFALVHEARALEGAIMERVAMIGQSDRFERGDWPGVRPLPTRDAPWFENAGASDTFELAPLAAMIADRNLSLEDKVYHLKKWLLLGVEPERYREQVDRERQDMLTALETGEIRIGVQEGVALVVSGHRAGVGLGYHLAPVVVACNPRFRFKDGPEHRKFTVAQFTEGHLDFRELIQQLNELERAACDDPDEYNNPWGGSPTIAGSPQGESSRLSLQTVADAVRELMN